ncbi:MAG: choice-of-anchor L domain-containing protein [Flavobacteriaceae bacterium]
MRYIIIFVLSIFHLTTYAQQNSTVDCTAGPVSTTFCYDTGLDNSYTFTSNDGTPLNLTIDEGQVENNWDELVIRDSDGTELYNGYGNVGDISGLTFQSSGDTIEFEVVEDGSISCVSSGYTPITFTVSCATCINPQVNYEVVSDCLNAPQFFVDVDVIDLGSAGSLTLSDNQGNSSSINNTGTVQFGPYANNTDVQFTAENDDDVNCSISSGSLTQEYCAVTLVDCAVGPVSSSYCSGNNDTTQFEYVSSDGSPLNLTIDSGNVENNYDELVIVDSDGVTELYNGYGNGGDITGLTFQSSGNTIYFSVISDGSVSCQSGSGALADGINYTVACATCTNPSAEYTVIDDCANGDQFLIDVNITSMGDADSLTISDNYGTNTEQTTTTGIVQMGPYPFLTDIVITTSNDQDVNCVINSNPIQLFACPPENDNCNGAVQIEANDGGECISSGSGTLVAATPSSETNSCDGSADDDVWFEFTAVSENHAISLSNIVGDTQDLYHVLYQGDDCGNLTQIYCSDDENSTANDLSVGENYFVRVYSYTANELSNLTFDICVFTVPPPIFTSTTLYTVEELVTDVLIDSECNQSFNISSSTGSDFGSTNGIGYFESNGSSWPFENGLIMTSGDVANAVGPESGVISDGDYNWPGDADLEAYIPGLNAGDTNNASILEFNFVPVSNNISFDFIFAAEEYGTFQCTFTDAFAFLLTDSSGNTTNLAIVPGTTDPISVLTVRDGQYNDSCESVNEEWFADYYGPGGLPPLTSPTNFLGHTEVMTAQSNVTPNELYTIKLVVADDGDTLYDSAVFIDGGSFDIGQLDLGEDILVSSGNALCEGQEIVLDAGALPNNSAIEWFMDGSLIENANDVTLVVTETAFYSATITVDNTDCSYSDDILVEFFQSPVIVPVNDYVIKCANEGFELEVNIENIDQLNSLTYIWTLDGVDLQIGPDNTYYLDENSEESGEFTVTVFDDLTYCWNSTTIDIEFYENRYCVDLPQGLSPNGDGFNDCLILDHLEDEEDIDRIDVFNRYGTKIYELNDYVDQWCGDNQDGEIMPVGTYFYIIYFNSSKEPITSWIYLNY